MAWDVTQLRHNASMLYNHLCSDDADRVYVDSDGHLQLDTRSWFSGLFSSLGNYSREATDAVVIRTLRRVLNAIENGTLNPDQIIIQDRVPIGMFMDEGEGVANWNIIKSVTVDPTTTLTSDRPESNRKWLNKDKFGMNIFNANRFHRPNCRERQRLPDHALTREELVRRKIVVLTQQIMFGKEGYQHRRRELPHFHFYDVSDDEAVVENDESSSQVESLLYLSLA